MLKNKKGAQKSNKIIKKTGDENPKKKKQQLENVKKSVKAGLGKTTAPVLVGGLPIKKMGGQKPKAKNMVLEDEQSEDETEEEDTDQSEVQSDEEDDQSANEEDMEQSEVETEEDEEDAEQSEVKDGEELSDAEECTEGIGHTLFVNNIPARTSRVELIKLFVPYGKVMSILFSTSYKIFFAKTLHKSGMKAFVVLDSVEAADKALVLNGTVINGSKLLVKKPNETGTFEFKKKAISNTSNTVFVSNLNKAVTSTDLQKFFSSCGETAYVKLLLSFKDRVSTGKAFVCFKSSDAADLALKLDKSILNEQPITVERYSPKNKNKIFNSQLKNLDNNQFKEKMLEIGKKIINKKNNTAKGEKKNNSEFRGVKAKGIKKVKKLES